MRHCLSQVMHLEIMSTLLCVILVAVSTTKKTRSEKGENKLKQCTEGHAETLKLNLAQLLYLISIFVSLQVVLQFLLDKYRLKYGDFFPPGSKCALY